MDIPYYSINYGTDQTIFTKFTAAIIHKFSKKATNYLKEIENQNSLKLEIFVKPILYFYDEKFLYVLYPLLKKNRFKPHKNQQKVYKDTKEFFSLLENLHKQKIGFRSLCLDNIFTVHSKTKLLRSQNLIHEKDLDLSNLKKSNFYWMLEPLEINPPELFERGWCDMKCDIWALGVFLFLKVNGKLPFSSKTYDFNFQLKEYLMENFKAHVDSDLQDLIRNMLKLDPIKRLDIDEI